MQLVASSQTTTNKYWSQIILMTVLKVVNYGVVELWRCMKAAKAVRVFLERESCSDRGKWKRFVIGTNYAPKGPRRVSRQSEWSMFVKRKPNIHPGLRQ